MSEVVLVTGAGGFVGRALTARLFLEDVPTVAMLRDRDHAWTPACTSAYGDVTDADFLRRVIADYAVTTIYHLAAESIVSVCAEDPVSAFDTAVGGTVRLLQAVRDSGRAIKVIVSTSDKVYGDAPPPYHEGTPLLAKHAYEASKACQDIAARSFFHNYGVDVRVVRAVNIYGPGDPNMTRLIPQTIKRCLAGDPAVVHAGAHTMQRQFLYISDLLDALFCVARNGTAGEAYCIGAIDGPRSVSDVIREIAVQCSASVQIITRVRDDRFQEIEAQSIDDRKLRALGWAPHVPFSEGIARAIGAARSEYDVW